MDSRMSEFGSPHIETGGNYWNQVSTQWSCYQFKLKYVGPNFVTKNNIFCIFLQPIITFYLPSTHWFCIKHCNSSHCKDHFDVYLKDHFDVPYDGPTTSLSPLKMQEKSDNHKKCHNCLIQSVLHTISFILSINNCNTLVPFHSQVGWTEAEMKGFVRKAIKVKQGHPTLSILTAIRVVKFTNQETKAYTFKTRVHCKISPPIHQLYNYFQWWYLINEYGWKRR